MKKITLYYLVVVILVFYGFNALDRQKYEKTEQNDTSKNGFFVDDIHYKLSHGEIRGSRENANSEGYDFELNLFSAGMITKCAGKGNFVQFNIASETSDDIKPFIYLFDENSRSPHRSSRKLQKFNGFLTVNMNCETWENKGFYVPQKGTLEVKKLDKEYEFIFDVIANSINDNDEVIKKNIKISGYYKGELKSVSR